MERTQILVIAVVVAAVAFFVLNVWSGDSVQPGAERTAMSRREGEEPTRGSERLGARGELSRSGSDVAGGRGERAPGQGASASRHSESGPVRGRLAESLRAGEGAREGSLGTSGSVRRGGSRGANVAASGGSFASERREGREGRGDGVRSDILETLASQKKSGKSDADGDGEPDGPNPEGVLLSLPLQKSTEAEDGTRPAYQKELEVRDDEGVKFTNDSVLAFDNAGNINGDKGTISFELEPEWDGSQIDDHFLVQMRSATAWENRIEILKNGTSMRFVFFDENGIETGVSAPIQSWTAGERHRVDANWDVEAGRMRLYLDSVLVGEAPITAPIRPAPDAKLYVGSDLPSMRRGLGGTMFGFKVQDRAIDP